MLPGTSVNCEWLFSAAKFILSATRKRTRSPTLFDAMLLLKVNSSYWNVYSVGQAIVQNKKGLVYGDINDTTSDVDVDAATRWGGGQQRQQQGKQQPRWLGKFYSILINLVLNNLGMMSITFSILCKCLKATSSSLPSSIVQTDLWWKGGHRLIVLLWYSTKTVWLCYCSVQYSIPAVTETPTGRK